MMNIKKFFRVILIVFLNVAQSLAADGYKEFMIISPYFEAGFFCHFINNLGFLDCYERGLYSGMLVDFEKRGLYYDENLGPNWWEYYFGPINVGSNENSVIKKFTLDEPIRLGLVIDLSKDRLRAFELIQRYVKIKPQFLQEVDEYIANHFQSQVIIGLHYRGTDKITSREAGYISYEKAAGCVKALIKTKQLTDYQIFVATDELKFLNYMKECFPDRVIYQEAMRSKDKNPFHLKKANPFQRGKEALIDSLLLSRCNCLIRTESNLSLASTFFNPDLPVFVLYGKKVKKVKKGKK